MLFRYTLGEKIIWFIKQSIILDFKFFKVYERIMEKLSFLRPFSAYNIAIVKNDK